MGCWKSLQLGTPMIPRDVSWYSPSAGSAHSLYCSGVQKGASPAWKGHIHQWAPATAAVGELGTTGLSAGTARTSLQRGEPRLGMGSRGIAASAPPLPAAGAFSCKPRKGLLEIEPRAVTWG